MSKFLYILVGIFLFVTSFFAGYLFRNNNKDAGSYVSSSLSRFSETAPENSSIVKSLEKLEQITSSKILTVKNGDSKNIFYTEKETGKIFQIDQDGLDRKAVSGTIIKNIEKAVWSPKKLELVYSVKNGFSPSEFYYFDPLNKNTIPFHPAIKSVSFSSTGEKIAYHFLGQNSEEGSIGISQPDGSAYKNILKIRLPSIVIDWPKNNLLSFYEHGIVTQEVNLFLFDIEKQEFSRIIEVKKGLSIKWSPSGNLLLYSYFDLNNNLILTLRDIKNKKEEFLPFSTFPEKCSFTINEEKIFCGIPLNLPGVPIKSSFVASKDKVIEFTFSSKNLKNIFEPTSFENIQVSSPFLSPLEDKLFFINLQDERLYRLNL